MSQIASKPPTQKNPSVRMPKLRAAARGAECMMNVPRVCNHDNTTTVLAHSNAANSGRGTGYKGNDWLAVSMCANCHSWYDQRSTDFPVVKFRRQELFDEAWVRQVRWWLEQGLLS